MGFRGRSALHNDQNKNGQHRIVIADDHPLFRGALRQALADGGFGLQVAEAGSLEEVVGAVEEVPETDIILLDLAMPGVKGFSGLMYLRAQYPDIPVVIVSATEDESVIRRCMEFGASGFIPKSVGADTIRSAFQAVLEGEVWVPPDLDLSSAGEAGLSELVARLATLTPQQVRVLMMLSEGLLNKQIAYELTVSEATVKAHVSAILQKLGVESRTQAVIAASRIEAGQWQDLAG
ncbi:MAG: response regulator transcription factor [Rhodobiaceae bacterium]|nr:response regulator transcription factor [Rhodobiaceae bacterium]